MLRALFVAALVAGAPIAVAAEPAQADAPVSAPAAPPPAAPVSPAPAVASAPQADPSLYGNPPDVPSEGTAYLLFKTLVVLGVVVAVIYLTLNVGARRLLKLGGPGSALVKVVDRVPLEPKKSLYVLQVGTEYLLVGSTEGSLSLISKLDPDSAQKALAERIQNSPPASGFLERLNALAKPAPRKPQ